MLYRNSLSLPLQLFCYLFIFGKEGAYCNGYIFIKVIVPREIGNEEGKDKEINGKKKEEQKKSDNQKGCN